MAGRRPEAEAAGCGRGAPPLSQRVAAGALLSVLAAAMLYRSGLLARAAHGQSGGPTVLCPDAALGWPNGSAAEPWEMLEAASCGSDYAKYYAAAAAGPHGTARRVDVALLGHLWDTKRRLSGCPLGQGGCPAFPGCAFFAAKTPLEAGSAQVVVVQSERRATIAAPPDRGDAQIWVLYWRQSFGSVPARVQASYDLTMGVHITSGLLNPVMLKKPSAMLRPFRGAGAAWVPFAERTEFAMSVVSHCGAASQRDRIEEELTKLVGEDRVHRYGRCGSLPTPPKPISNLAGTASRYKFYLAFENSIRPGYVSEKLFVALRFGALPVYLGAPNVIRITATPSYVNVLDFGSVAALAGHLQFLAGNETAYMEYHAWRLAGERGLDPEYMRLASGQIPTHSEISALNASELAAGSKTSSREAKLRLRAACCRLCNLNWVAELARRRRDASDAEKEAQIVRSQWSKRKIEQRLRLAPAESRRRG